VDAQRRASVVPVVRHDAERNLHERRGGVLGVSPPMTKVTCPVCKSTVDRLPIMGEMLPPELDERGIPWACAVSEGFGLPVVQPGRWAITVDGVPVDACVAFDRRAGAAWHYPKGPDGRLIRAGDEFYVERLNGVVTVEALRRDD